jgi:hemerythrin
MALARLDKLVARPRPNAEAMDDFFVELSDLVRHYLEDHFALHAPELTTEEFLDVAAGSPDLTADHRQFLQRFLRSADRVKFARHVPGQRDVEEILTAVRDFLQQTAEQTDRDHAHAGPTEEQVHA